MGVPPFRLPPSKESFACRCSTLPIAHSTGSPAADEPPSSNDLTIQTISAELSQGPLAELSAATNRGSAQPEPGKYQRSPGQSMSSAKALRVSEEPVGDQDYQAVQQGPAPEGPEQASLSPGPGLPPHWTEPQHGIMGAPAPRYERQTRGPLPASTKPAQRGRQPHRSQSGAGPATQAA
ncbi:hypothetical protein NDU88_002541 [Pleurodeles waltl]|uniref:Androgen receptor n=1 Tax=Pleurodeles waltl TaxID=8319 RepID=A0AAV7RA97_PLEWA|nr:hypothetical protein NDU88_002541 [Pleurodeles waltl]